MSRIISGLVSARRLPERPAAIPIGRPKGIKALGVRYERAFARQLPFGEASVWWEFTDTNGPGWCQTDVLVVGAERALVLECKYTYTTEAWKQLELLYRPVVGKALGLPVLGVQVCKLLVPQRDAAVARSLGEAVALAKRTPRVVLHWTGFVPVA